MSRMANVKKSYLLGFTLTMNEAQSILYLNSMEYIKTSNLPPGLQPGGKERTQLHHPLLIHFVRVEK